MKKLLLLSAVLFILSCDKEDEKTDCNCKKAKFITSGNSNGFFYIDNLKIDCKTGQPIQQVQQNAVYVGCEN